MKTLSTIQKLAKIGRILSKIMFICAIVGGALCLAGLICLCKGIEDIQIGDVTIKGLIEDEVGQSMGVFYASVASGMILCAAEAVLAYFAMRYFEHELADGTPFRIEGAQEMFRLGILTICIPIGARIVTSLVCGIIEAVTHDKIALEIAGFESVSLGVMFLVLSLVCRYGAEQAAGTDKSANE